VPVAALFSVSRAHKNNVMIYIMYQQQQERQKAARQITIAH
jgi:hypothetical protein